MHNNFYACFAALKARDGRFDGKFFTGVKSTGVYCRPICPAQPKAKNVEFFPSATDAERAGYRPCLRCRTESAPMSAAWIGKSATVRRALKIISQNRRAATPDDRLATQLGVSTRHLRRLFAIEIGQSPKQISDRARLNFARKLIVETQMPITEICFASGFGSVRRFNDAFQKRFARRPRDLRVGGVPRDESSIRLGLAYRPPLDWTSVISFYRRHLIPGVETITGESYARVFRGGDGKIGVLRVAPNPRTKNELQLTLDATDAQVYFEITQRVRHMFDLDSDPMLFESALSSCAVLGPLLKKYPGLRLPHGFDPFETSIGAILGQLVSVEHAGRLVGQLVENYGEKITNPVTGVAARLFPSPEVLARVELAKLGTTGARKASIREFARAVALGKIKLDSAQDPQAFRAQMLAIKGIGPWTAEYIALRAIGDADAFPGSDLILKRALAQAPAPEIESFRPWRAYSAMYLWKEFAGTLSKRTSGPKI